MCLLRQAGEKNGLLGKGVLIMKRDDCIFCRLANGDIPTRSVYEDEKFNVIMDTNPASKGHVLILPKDHYADIHEIPGETVEKVMRLAKTMADRLAENLDADGINIVQNNGKAAGQTVFHFHLHIIPRYAGGPAMVTWEPQELPAEEMDAIQKQILG